MTGPTPYPEMLRSLKMNVIAENTEKPKISKYLFEIIALIITVISKIVIIILKSKFQ